jgi:hypothetical protein
MKNAISIFDSLYSYWEDVVGPANWRYDIEKYILVLLLKIHFETDYIQDIMEIVD